MIRNILTPFTLSCILTICCSCTKEPFTNIKSKYTTESLLIQKDGLINCLDTTEYSIKIEANLSVPDSSIILDCNRLKFDEGHYYLQTEGKNMTIWVFDSVGNFVSKLGERGRAKNEYQTDITDWFRVSDSDEIVVFERNSRKVHTFSIHENKSSAFILESWPNSIGVLNKGKLFCSYYHKEAKEGLQLALLTNNEDIKSDFMYLGQNMAFVPSDLCFYKIADRLFHVPSFADSAIVFRADTVEKIVRFNFEDTFISEDIKQEAYKDHLERLRCFEGIKYIESYYETSKYDVIKFVYNKFVINHLIDKTDGRQFRFSSALPMGIFPSTVFCVRDNKIYYVITKENVEETRTILTPKVYESELTKSSNVIKDIFNNKVSLPVIVSIEINHQ